MDAWQALAARPPTSGVGRGSKIQREVAHHSPGCRRGRRTHARKIRRRASHGERRTWRRGLRDQRRVVVQRRDKQRQVARVREGKLIPAIAAAVPVSNPRYPHFEHFMDARGAAAGAGFPIGAVRHPRVAGRWPSPTRAPTARRADSAGGKPPRARERHFSARRHGEHRFTHDRRERRGGRLRRGGGRSPAGSDQHDRSEARAGDGER